MYEDNIIQAKEKNSINNSKNQGHQQNNSFYNNIMQLQSIIGNKAVTQLLNNQNTEKQQSKSPLQMKKENNTGLPDDLKNGVENLSGLSMDDVRVHYNSDKPKEIGALAYTQGSDIHVSPGEERHLGHEMGHVVQQKQGRVKTTIQFKGGVNVNDDISLENEADIMGEKALLTHNIRNEKNITPIQMISNPLNEQISTHSCTFNNKSVIQLKPELNGNGIYTDTDFPGLKLSPENIEKLNYGYATFKLLDGTLVYYLDESENKYYSDKNYRNPINLSNFTEDILPSGVANCNGKSYRFLESLSDGIITIGHAIKILERFKQEQGSGYCEDKEKIDRIKIQFESKRTIYPISLNENNNFSLVDGRHRILASRDLGLSYVPYTLNNHEGYQSIFSK